MRIEQKPTDIKIKMIDPKIADKFSPNLYRWMRKNSFMQRWARVFEDKEKTLWIGFYDGEFDFVGSRLIEVLRFGARAQSGSYGNRIGNLKERSNFWEQYLIDGRCAIDREHSKHFIDDTRWKVTGRKRICLWCGNCTQVQKSKRSVRVDKFWETKLA